MLGYLGVPFVSFLAPLAVYLARARQSPFARQHAAQALNLSITLLLYNLCVLILAGILALDSVGVALQVAGPVALALWLAALYFLTRAALSASRGAVLRLPPLDLRHHHPLATAARLIDQVSDHRVGQQPAPRGQRQPPGVVGHRVGQPVGHRRGGGRPARRAQLGQRAALGQPGGQHDPLHDALVGGEDLPGLGRAVPRP